METHMRTTKNYTFDGVFLAPEGSKSLVLTTIVAGSSSSLDFNAVSARSLSRVRFTIQMK